MALTSDKAFTNYGLLIWSGTNQLASRVIPSYTLFPVNSDRTAWQQFGYPVVLTIPGRRNPDGLEVAGTLPDGLTVRVLGAPDRPFVAGHDHVGLRYPERIVYVRTLSVSELLSVQVDASAQEFQNSAGEAIDFADAVDGDWMVLNLDSGVFDKIVYHPDTDYYDLSSIRFETVNLQTGYYAIEYALTYQQRVLTRDDSSVICITDDLVPATCTIPLNHPGDVLGDLVGGLPGVMLTGADLASDPMVTLLRPLSEILQDVFDEQWFLQAANWVRDIPFPLVPYLVPTLGWDIPFFPRSADDLRRAVLLSLVEIQKARGSLHAINRLFNLFGFTILVNNLYYLPGLTDAPRSPSELVREIVGPGEYPGFELDTQCVVDPVLVDEDSTGFGDFDAPLVYRPQSTDGVDPFRAGTDSGQVTLHSFLVVRDSEIHLALRAYVNDGSIGPLLGAACATDAEGFLTTDRLVELEASSADQGLLSHNVLRFDNGRVVASRAHGDGGPISNLGSSMNVATNRLALQYDRYRDFVDDTAAGDTVVMALAVYERIALTIPDELDGLRSNYFDVQMLSKASRALPTDASVLGFLLDFIYRVKAAHSLLRSFRYLSTLDEVYAVSGLCVGHDVTQRYDVDAGLQQVPPAVIATIPEGACLDSPNELVGFKPEDYAYRNTVLVGLEAEYQAYRRLAGRVTTAPDAALPVAAADDCGFLFNGQSLALRGSVSSADDLVVIPGIGSQRLAAGGYPANRVPANRADHVHTRAAGQNDSGDKLIVAEGSRSRSTYDLICTPSPTQDWCYKGRVEDEVVSTTRVVQDESWTVGGPGCRSASLGVGVFWYYRSPSTKVFKSGATVDVRPGDAVARRLRFTGGTLRFGEDLLPEAGPNGLSGVRSRVAGWLGRMLAGQDKSTLLCYDNRPGLTDVRAAASLALTPEPLNIQVPFMHFPGCRFPTLGNLQSDFTSPTVRARPWDQQIVIMIRIISASAR
jgi:hypothetical protein